MRFQTALSGSGAEPVVTLTDTVTGCQAEIYAFGALLNAFCIPCGNERVNVADGFVSVGEARKNIHTEFKSAKLSPFVCRMRGGKYEFENSSYTIEKYSVAGHAIHGLLFDVVFNITHTYADEEKAEVILQHQYNGEDTGYPFAYSIEIKWQLEKENRLRVITTITNRHHHTIPLADGWHPYFSLGGSLDDCTLQFNSSKRLEYDADLLPTGKIEEDQRFVNGISLKGIELDNSFLFEENQPGPACILKNKKLELCICPDKNYSILQIYIPPHRNSIAIENLTGAPDNFNNKIGVIDLGAKEEKMFEVCYWLRSKL